MSSLPPVGGPSRILPALPTAPTTGPRGAPGTHAVGRTSVEPPLREGEPGASFARRGEPSALEVQVGVSRARAALAAGTADAALAALDASWTPSSEGAAPWYARGAALLLLGRARDAADVVGEGRRRHPGSPAMPYLAALGRLASGDVHGAAGATADALALRPESPLLLSVSALVLAAAGQEGQARLALGLVRQRAPDHPAARLVRAALAELGAATSEPESGRAGAGPTAGLGSAGASIADAMPLERALLVLGFELADADAHRVRDVTPHSSSAVSDRRAEEARAAAALAAPQARAARPGGSALVVALAVGAAVLSGAHWGWTGAAAAAVVALLLSRLRR